MALIARVGTSFSTATKAVASTLLLVAIAGCGVRSRPIPDLNDQAAVDAVVEQLGADVTPDQAQRKDFPDGLYFQWWVNRRIKTLTEKEGRCDVPAPEAPGSIGEAVAIERRVAPQQIALDRNCSDLMLQDLNASIKRETEEENARLAAKDARVDAAATAFSTLAKRDDACRQRQQDAEFALADPRKIDEFVAQHPCEGGNITGR